MVTYQNLSNTFESGANTLHNTAIRPRLRVNTVNTAIIFYQYRVYGSQAHNAVVYDQHTMLIITLVFLFCPKGKRSHHVDSVTI